MEMIFILLVGLFISGYDLYQKYERHRFLKKFYPEYMRDRNKPLKTDQIWTNSAGSIRAIKAISNGRVFYYAYHPSTNRGAQLSDTIEEFRENINKYQFYLQT